MAASVRSVASVAVCIAVLCGCGRDDRIERLEWPAMGTVAAVQVRAPESGEISRALRDCVRSVFSEVEALLSAHNPGSELNKLAAFDDGGVLSRCDVSVRPCYEAAFRLRDETGGRFDPRWRGKGTLDLGAIAKGFAADLAAEAARKTPEIAKCGGLLVDIGGNLKAAKGEWRVSVFGDPSRAPLRLGENAAVATSGAYFRGDHIVDARDGSKASPPAYSVSAVHPSSAMLADGLSTACFIYGEEEGGRFARSHYPEARIIWLHRGERGRRRPE